MDYINDLYELCETISREIAEANEKIRAAGGKLSGGDYDTIDKITHALKSVKATIKMMEDEGGGYSGDNGSYRYSREGGSYRGGSYARGRGSYRGGRNSNRGYSRDGGLADELRELMEDAPNEAVRRDMQKLLDKVDQM